MRVLPLLLLAACAVMPEGPASPGSPSAELSARAAEIAAQAANVETLAATLESEVDEGRRRMERGESTQEQETTRARALMAQIEAENSALQTAIADWERDIAEAAGNTAPAPPASPPPAAAPPPRPSQPIQVAPTGDDAK